MSEYPSIVSAEWLSRQLDSPEIAIADCRFRLSEPDWGQQQYQHNHIPGAYYFHLDRDLSCQVRQHEGRHPLPDPAQLAEKLARCGINYGKTLVVAYDNLRFAFAARLWWLLRYLGHDRVALLDGGWSAWQAGGYPVTPEVPPPQTGTFIPQPRHEWIVDRETVIATKDLPNVVLVDSRDGDRYRGEREPIDPVAGHIPGAINLPWQEVTDEQGYFTSLAQQHSRWSKYSQATEIIVYCGSGVTACVNLLSLDQLGIANAKLYPGGWSEWCSYRSD